MNHIVFIEEFIKGDKVTFYTLRYEESELSETDKFFKKYSEDKTDYKDDLDIIANWIKEIGQRGLKSIRLREENDAHALPPYTETSKLRLFCIKLTDSIILLGNGGLKTSQEVQKSDQLSLKFYEINQISRIVNEAIYDGSLIIDNKELRGDLELFF